MVRAEVCKNVQFFLRNIRINPGSISEYIHRWGDVQRCTSPRTQYFVEYSWDIPLAGDRILQQPTAQATHREKHNTIWRISGCASL